MRARKRGKTGGSRVGLTFAMAPVVALLGVLLAPSRAAAGSCDPGPVGTSCINSDAFWPHAGGGAFLEVGGTETVAPGTVGFGLVTSYLSRPIDLHIPSPGPGGSDQHVVDNQVNGSFLWGFGITRRLELDFVLPVTFGQSGTGLGPLTSQTTDLADTAIRDLRFGLAYALVPRDALGKVWSLTGRFEVSAPTGDRAQFAGERSAVFVPSVAADYRRGRWFAGIEVGARVRPVEKLVAARIGTQGVLALGVGVDLVPRNLLAITAEARALPTFAKQATASVGGGGYTYTESDAFLVPSEWALAVRTAPLLSGDLGIQLGGGGAIPFGGEADVTAPRFRFTLALRYAPLAHDRDGDGVRDGADRCPDVPGPQPGGCPPEPTSSIEQASPR